VVGIATLALGLALVIRIKEAYGSIEEGEIQDQDISDLLESHLEAYGPNRHSPLHRQDTVE
jgi:multicomponent Na+:H+ antiporter subunit C